MRHPIRLLAASLTVGLFSSFFVSVSAQADPPTGVDTTNSRDSASLEILMGSVVGGSSRNTISEVNTPSWVWIDGTSDLTTLLTSSTTPSGSESQQNASYNTLSDQYYYFQNPNYVRNPANTINGVQVNQGNPTSSGAVAIDWSSGSKLPGSGGFLTKISVYDDDGFIKANARYRLQVLGKDTIDNVYKVLGNGGSGTQFSPSSAKPSMTFYDCDPSASSSCAPIAAADTPGGKNPTFDATNAGAGEAYGITNSSGFAYVWVTMTGVAASNLFHFQLRLSDAEADDLTDFPADQDFSDVFPARIISGSGYTPTSTNGSATLQEMPWKATAAGKNYTTQASFRITTSCLWGSTIADPGASTSVISPDTKTAGTGDSTLTVTIKNRCGTALSGQKITIVKPDGTHVVLTTNGSGVATLAVTDTGSAWTGDFDTHVGDFPTGTPPTGEPFASPTMTFQAPPAANAGNSEVVIDDDTDTADGTSTSIVTVTVKDQYGNPVGAGQSVCFTVTNGDGTISNGPWVTDANGQVTTTVTAPTSSGQTQINAALGTCASPQGSIGTVTYNHEPGAADAPTSDVTIETDTASSDGTTETTVTVVVRDANGNPVGAGQAVCLVLADGTGTLSSGPWVTDSEGRVTATVTSPASPGFAQIDAAFGTCDSPGENIGAVNVNFVDGYVPPSDPESSGSPLPNTGLSSTSPLVPLTFLTCGLVLVVASRIRRKVN
jgi:hypothetical protein